MKTELELFLEAAEWALRKPSFIFVLGACHELQRLVDLPERDELAHKFMHEVDALSEAHGFDLFCEEIDQCDYSLVEQYAQTNKKRYINIDMPGEVRTLNEIPDGYAYSNTHAAPDVMRWHRLREDYMYRRSVERMSVPNWSVLVVCGSYHVKALASRFKELNCEVETADAMKFSWFNGEVYKPEYAHKAFLARE